MVVSHMYPTELEAFYPYLEYYRMDIRRDALRYSIWIYCCMFMGETQFDLLYTVLLTHTETLILALILVCIQICTNTCLSML